MGTGTKVVNMRDKAACRAAEAAGLLVYVGRKRGPLRWGNPFTSKPGTLASMVVDNPLTAHREWLAGTAYVDFMQDERAWVLEHLHELRGKTLGCWCAPSPCHADTLAKMADALEGAVVPAPAQPAPASTPKKEIWGLTIWQPWAWLITHNTKRVENRGWRPPDKAIGQYLALHAGKTLEPGVQAWLWSQGISVIIPADLPAGAVVGVARLTGVVSMASQLPVEQQPWFAGPFGWTLSDVVAIEPVECAGSQGLWRLPPAVLAEVRGRYREALEENNE